MNLHPENDCYRHGYSRMRYFNIFPYDTVYRRWKKRTPLDRYRKSDVILNLICKLYILNGTGNCTD